MPYSLIEFWRRCDLTRKPFIHPNDEPQLPDRYVHSAPLDFQSYVHGPDFNRPNDNRLHVSLIPNPYLGDLSKADIFILMLNPGFHFSDYAAEENDTFRRRFVQTLHQDLGQEAYPFIFLDPELCWHSGFGWWERKFKSILLALAERDGYLKAMQLLANRIAAIELMTYHSPSFGVHRVVETLPSVQAARAFVRGPLSARAKAGDALIIATRQVKAWGLDPSLPNIVLYDVAHARGASLSIGTLGGDAIMKRLVGVGRRTPVA